MDLASAATCSAASPFLVCTSIGCTPRSLQFDILDLELLEVESLGDD
jgi:hypothetical protein